MELCGTVAGYPLDADFIGKVDPALVAVRNVPLSAMPVGGAQSWVVPVAAGTSDVIAADELSRFDRCPRRFLYTYLLGLAGRQRETPFVKAHDCVYETIRAAREHNKAGDKDWLLRRLESSWKELGPHGHPYETDYPRIAEQTIANFETACAGLDIQKVGAVAVDLLHGKVEVNPDQMAKRADGTMLLRRIRTGMLSKDEVQCEYILSPAVGRLRVQMGVLRIVAPGKLDDLFLGHRVRPDSRRSRPVRNLQETTF